MANKPPVNQASYRQTSNGKQAMVKKQTTSEQASYGKEGAKTSNIRFVRKVNI